jgi:hypothetical protein
LDEIQNYLYPSSFVVQVLIFQTWISFNNDGLWNCDSKEKYDDETKIILNFLFKKSFSRKMLSNSRNIIPLTQLLSTTLYIYFMENWGALRINNY